MMNLFKKLVPLKGFLWKILFGDDLQKFLSALSEEPIRIRNYLLKIVTESNPGTAVDTQEEWYQQYGIPYKPTKSLSEKQAETLERYIALGDQDIVYFQDQVNKAGFDEIVILENTLPTGDETNECGVAECGSAICGSFPPTGQEWIFYFYVLGDVDNDDEVIRLKALVQRLSPGHTIPIYVINSSNNVCGNAECGLAICDG